MKDFFDTSVLVAAFWKDHPQHERSLALVSAATPRRAACGLHTLAEVYATMTVLPKRQEMSPEHALLFVDEVRERFTIVTLDQQEYYDTIVSAAALGFTTGRIYDALLLRCAAKIKADTIYTWNLKQFLATDPKQARKIRTP